MKVILSFLEKNCISYENYHLKKKNFKNNLFIILIHLISIVTEKMILFQRFSCLSENCGTPYFQFFRTDVAVMPILGFPHSVISFFHEILPLWNSQFTLTQLLPF